MKSCNKRLSAREWDQFEADRLDVQVLLPDESEYEELDILMAGMAIFDFLPQEECLLRIASYILRFFGLEQEAERFLASGDGLAILANCCNAAAKWYESDLYQFKPYLIRQATSQCNECWQDAGIVYIETCVGQVSFHALYGEDQGLPEAFGRAWSGIEYQWNAPIVARAFLDSWSKEDLQQAIRNLDEEVA